MLDRGAAARAGAPTPPHTASAPCNCNAMHLRSAVPADTMHVLTRLLAAALALVRCAVHVSCRHLHLNLPARNTYVPSACTVRAHVRNVV